MKDEDKPVDETEEEEIEEPIEEVSEEPTEAPTVEATKPPESVPSEKAYICSVCGELVTPIEIPTDRGVRYRCPHCKKFMRRLSPDEVQSVTSVLAGDDDGVVLPPDVIMVDIVKTMLNERLPSIYGLPITHKKAVVAAIVDTVTRRTIRDPMILHAHVKGFAKNINEKHLESLIVSIYGRLQEEGYGTGDSGYTPTYGEVGFESTRYGGYGNLRQDMGIREERDKQTSSTGEMVMMIGGVPVKTNDPAMYMAWKRDQREQVEAEDRKEDRKLKRMKLEEEIKQVSSGGSGNKELVKIPNPEGNGTIEVPAYLVPFYLKSGDAGSKKELAEERKRTDDAKEVAATAREQRLADIIEGLANRPSFAQELAEAKATGAAMGMSPTGKTSVDLFSEAMLSLDTRVGQMLNRLPAGSDEEFQPQISRTQEERQQKAGEIMDGIDRSEDVLEAENELIDAARKAQPTED